MADSKQTIDEQVADQQSEEQQSESPGASAPGAQPCDVEASHSDGDASAIEGDLDELVAVGAQRDEYLALAQRTQADFENYRKRVARESAAAQERGMAALAKELLPALDNLDRAMADAGKATGEA